MSKFDYINEELADFTNKQNLLNDLQEVTAQCMLDFRPEITHIDNDYVAGFIENSDEDIFEDICDRAGIEFDEDTVIDMLVEFVLTAEPFEVAVADLDYSSEGLEDEE